MGEGGGGEDAKWTAPLHARWRTHWSEQCTKLPCTMWACTYGIDCWIPAELVGCLSTKLTNCLTAKPTYCLTAKFDDCLTAKLVNRLTAKLVNRLTAKLLDRLTARLVNRLTTKLVVVNLAKLHLTRFNKHLSADLLDEFTTCILINLLWSW